MAFSRRSLVVRLRSIIRGGGGGVDLADAVVDVVDVLVAHSHLHVLKELDGAGVGDGGALDTVILRC